MNALNIFALASTGGTYKAFSGEAWQFAGEMTLLGMGMIFAVLSVLMGVLMIFKLVFAKPEKKASEETKVEVKPEVVEAAPASQEPQNNNDETLIAVITAAIAEYRAAEGLGDGGFRVVSFKRSGNGHWNAKK